MSLVEAASRVQLRGQLQDYGLKVGMVGVAGFDASMRERVADLPAIAFVIPLLSTREGAADAARRGNLGDDSRRAD